MDLRRLCNVVYEYLVEGRDAAGKAELDAILAGAPPPGAEPPTRKVPPADRVGMDALMRAMTLPQVAG